MIGQVVGNYRILGELGKGGMGLVYRAEHVQLGRQAALKMLLPQFSSDPSIVQRFFNEARAASAIEHPGIVLVHDYGTHTDGSAYIVMELLKGETLTRRLSRGRLSPVEGAALISQVLGALGAAHARGIVHRDLKPDNIFLVPNELMPGGVQVKLLDFGIAKLAGDGAGGGMRTQTGMMMGTPAYMSPEQCMGRSDLDHRTDLYAIGCILYHLFLGRPPFLSDQGTGMMIAMHIRDLPSDPRTIDPSIPDALASIVMKLLEKEPAARYQTASDVRDALAGAGAGAPSRPPQPVAPQFAATMAPQSGATMTTNAGAAAQLVAAHTQPPTKGRGFVIAGVGILLAGIVGTGVYVALRDSNTTPKAAQVAPAALPQPALPAPGGALPHELATATTAADAAPCPLGKMRGLDTKDHCCWPEQAWSTSKNTCVGSPKCPEGHRVSGEECIVLVADGAHAPRVPPQPAQQKPVRDDARQSPPPPDGPVPTFKLPASKIAPNTKITITFSSPVASPDGNRSWITIVEAQKPPTQYGNWTYIDDGATTATLNAPAETGAYEVRLHTDYPRLSTNVRRSVPVTIAESGSHGTAGGTPRSDQRFMLASKVGRAGDKVELTFPVALKAAQGERFWVTVVKQGTADTSWGAYEYVQDGARSMEMDLPTEPGEYEIRLHANYPRLTTNLVHRAAIRVED